MQCGVDGPSRHAMNPHSNSPVALHLGGDIGDERQVSNPPLGVETPLVRCRFPLLYLLHDVVNLYPLKGLVAIHLLDSFL